MKAPIIPYALGAFPGFAAVLILISGWAAWVAKVPLHQHLSAARIIMDGVFTNFGTDVGIYLRACPSILTGTTLAAQLVSPASVILMAAFARAPTMAPRLRHLSIGALFISFIPHAMGAIACASLIPGVQMANLMSWTISLWTRSAILLLPTLALALAAASLGHSKLARVTLSLLAVMGWVLLEQHHHASAVLRSFLYNVSAPQVFMGALWCVLIAALFLGTVPLLQVLLRSTQSRFSKRCLNA